MTWKRLCPCFSPSTDRLSRGRVTQRPRPQNKGRRTLPGMNGHRFVYLVYQFIERRVITNIISNFDV